MRLTRLIVPVAVVILIPFVVGAQTTIDIWGNYTNPYLKSTARVGLPSLTLPSVRLPSLNTYTPRTYTPTYGSDLSVMGQDGTYLGKVGGRYESESVNNPYGRYGSKYSSESVNNPYGRWGSRYSSEGASNPYASSPPVIVDSFGDPVKTFSANRYSTTPSRTELKRNILNSLRSNPSQLQTMSAEQLELLLKILKE